MKTKDFSNVYLAALLLPWLPNAATAWSAPDSTAHDASYPVTNPGTQSGAGGLMVSGAYTNGAWQVRFVAQGSNNLYALERSTDLLTWTPVDNAIAGSNVPVSLADQNPPAMRSFYRVRMGGPPLIPAALTGGSYTTTFPNTENPISESGNWINGGTVGLDWANIRTTPGFAYSASGLPSTYGDPTAVLAGTWGPNQTASAVVKINSAPSGGQAEVELRLRSSISAHRCTGYEFLWSVFGDYCQIVRWNGPLGSFSVLDGRGLPRALRNGDVVMAKAVGSTLSIYFNGALQFSVTDGTFATGSPGIGFYPNSSGLEWGFSSFTASDGTTGGGGGAPDTIAPSTPTGLSATATSSSQINLSWNASTDNTGVAGYRIYRGSTQVATSGSTTFSDTGLSPSTSYTYRVSAYDAAGNASPQSATASATTGASSGGGGPPDTIAPSTPTGLSATAISSSQINLSWKASTDNIGVAGYRIYRGGTQVATSGSNTFSDTGLSPSTSCTYRVSAYDAAGNASPQSATASATTLAQTGRSWAHRQTGARNSSAASNALAFGAATQSGDLIIVEVDWSSGSTFTSLSDSQGNVYTQIGAEQSSAAVGVKSRLYYARNIKGGADTITSVVTGSPLYHELYIHEYSGLSATNPLDAYSVNVGSGGSFTSGNLTTTTANELLYGVEIDSGAGSASAGWTTRSTLDSNVAADKNMPTVGTAAFTGSSAGAFIAWIAAFK
jgi:chitodextrinase